MSSELQKASFVKRLSALMLDALLVAILTILVALGLSYLTGYDTARAKLEERYNIYETQYDIDFDRFDSYEDPVKVEAYDSAYRALLDDNEAIKLYNQTTDLIIMITSLSLFIGMLGIEFVLPLIFKNGQTLGKKIFGLALMHTNEVKITPLALFCRTVLGKYAIETMVPVALFYMVLFGSLGRLGMVIILAFLLLQILLYLLTRTHSLIHDLLANTVVVDYLSQRIFDSREDMINYYKEKAAQEVDKERY